MRWTVTLHPLEFRSGDAHDSLEDITRTVRLDAPNVGEAIRLAEALLQRETKREWRAETPVADSDKVAEAKELNDAGAQFAKALAKALDEQLVPVLRRAIEDAVRLEYRHRR
jgi:predicted negative regulator of RcsB-dependent stress response